MQLSTGAALTPKRRNNCAASDSSMVSDVVVDPVSVQTVVVREDHCSSKAGIMYYTPRDINTRTRHRMELRLLISGQMGTSN